MFVSWLLVRFFKDSIIDLPSPKNMSYFWNFGFILGLFLFFQIFSGIFLSFYYICDSHLAFSSVDTLIRDVDGGWLLRMFHAKGASVYFLVLYMHMFRGMYYHSYMLRNTWLIGSVMFVLSMAVAFLGYVLPWGNMSFWGATVMTNFFSAIPYLGNTIVVWLWGGFSVGSPTLTRFFSFHFLLPFVLLFFVFLHIVFLHEAGSNKPLGVCSFGDKVNFHPYFTFKDLVGFMFIFILFFILNFGFPYLFMDSENFLEANLLSTPSHMQPEWYFLAAYAVLRSIPSKLGGVIVLLLFVFIFFFIPFLHPYNFRGSQFYVFFQFSFFLWVVNFFLLSLMGGSPMEIPFLNVGRFLTFFYFFYFFDLMSFYNFFLNNIFFSVRKGVNV